MNKLVFNTFLFLHYLSFNFVVYYILYIATNYWMIIGGIGYSIVLWINYYYTLMKNPDFKQYTHEIN